MGSKWGYHCCLLVWRISRKRWGHAVVRWGVQGAWVSHQWGLGADTQVGVEWVLAWRGSSDPICRSACGSSWLWVPRNLTVVLGFCSTDVLLSSLGPTKRGRTSKDHMPHQRPFPAASCPACSQPYAHPAPPGPFWKGALFEPGRAGHIGAACFPGTPLGSASLPAPLHPMSY